jgi:cell division septation protein DedD
MNDHREMELTVGWGNLFAIFFGIVILCALFFGWGFKAGLKSASPEAAAPAPAKSVNSASAPKPSAVHDVRDDAALAGSVNAQPGPRLELFKEKPDAKPTLSPAATASRASQKSPDTAPKAVASALPPAPEIKPMAGNGNFVVQVAAVSKQEDAGALVNALLKKNYPVFVLGNVPGDKLFHVQVGPFATLKDAESMRSRLAGDGYNPILKK